MSVNDLATSTTKDDKEVVNNIIENIIDGPNSSVIAGDTASNIASGLYSFATGNGTSATGSGAIASGFGSEASGTASSAENAGAANGDLSHAEGRGTTGKDALYAHAENAGTANGQWSHAQGSGIAHGNYSSASGIGTVASWDWQTVIGKFNALSDNDESTDAALVIGGGSSVNARSDIFSVDWSGNVNICGNYYINGVPIGSGGGGGGGLPEVTTVDNGKFLRVVDGVWAAATVLEAGGNSF